MAPGYIGAHTAKALAEAGYRPVVFDNLGSGHRQAVRWGPFVHGDIRDGRALREAIAEHGVAGAIHFAGLIEVGRSMVRPDLFYEHNVTGTAVLLAALKVAGVGRLVFSSSAAVYGETKLIGERMIEAHCRAFGLAAVALRYFNAAGANTGGLIGEAHNPETHLIPLAINAGLGRGKPLTVFGRDFATPDGSCLRDYIHVGDLARAHVAALAAPMEAGDFLALTVGTGQGRSVMEVIAAVDRAPGRPTPYSVGARRAGDPASLVADPGLISRRLDWSARESSLDNINSTAAAWARDPKFGV